MSINLRDEDFRESKMEDRRRGVRVNSRVPVAIEWEDAQGRPCRVEVSTRIVNPYGCLVVLPMDMDLDKRVQLTNLATQRSNPAVIVWKGQARSEGCEVGIELVSPGMDFWGLEL